MAGVGFACAADAAPPGTASGHPTAATAAGKPADTPAEPSGASAAARVTATSPGAGHSKGKGAPGFEPVAAAEHFFATAQQPANLAASETAMRSFVATANKQGRRVVIVTSGGTTVPLERNTVRFIDNFSTGTRGARSAEEFLRLGYAVVFLHRAGSVRPFNRSFARFSENLDSHIRPAHPEGASAGAHKRKHGHHSGSGARDGDAGDDSGAWEVAPHALTPDLLHALAGAREAREAGTLLEVPFVTISDYLWLLRASSHALAGAGTRGLMFMAAAVSDYYVPWEDMAVHKIQSAGGSNTLDLTLKPVPKILGYVRHLWCPDAMSVSFKLETDRGLLLSKARKAIENYGVHYVLANMLQHRYDEIFVVSPLDEQRITRPTAPRAALAAGTEGKGAAAGVPGETPVIEQAFVPRVAELHRLHIDGAAGWIRPKP